jgi:hypothetical protein
MGDKFVAALALWMFVVVVMGATVGFSYLRYRECRAHGFSIFYCVTK